jgi:hypothetical protein
MLENTIPARPSVEQSEKLNKGDEAARVVPFLIRSERKNGKSSPKVVKRPKAKKYTLAEALSEAFTYEQNSSLNTLDLEKALRCVSYLLVWSSQTSDEAVPGVLAYGLSEVLDECARKTRSLTPRRLRGQS